MLVCCKTDFSRLFNVETPMTRSLLILHCFKITSFLARFLASFLKLANSNNGNDLRMQLSLLDLHVYGRRQQINKKNKPTVVCCQFYLYRHWKIIFVNCLLHSAEICIFNVTVTRFTSFHQLMSWNASWIWYLRSLSAMQIRVLYLIRELVIVLSKYIRLQSNLLGISIFLKGKIQI